MKKTRLLGKGNKCSRKKAVFGPLNSSNPMKLQTGVEMIIILAVGLSILFIMLAINQQTMNTADWQIRSNQAKALVDDIANGAELVYSQGEGARTRVFVNVPNDVQTIYFSSNLIELTFRSGEKVYRTLDFNLSGSLPTVEGNTWVVIESRENDSLVYSEAAGYCGNSVQESANSEDCDGTDLGGETCTGLGYAGGTLACYSDCSFDISACD